MAVVVNPGLDRSAVNPFAMSHSNTPEWWLMAHMKVDTQGFKNLLEGSSFLKWRSLSLGVLFTSEGRMDCEIDRRIGAEAAVMQSMYRSVVVKKELSWKTTHTRVLEVLPICGSSERTRCYNMIRTYARCQGCAEGILILGEISQQMARASV
ncbi:hypothetical protein QTP70_011333 [Hemibagrus guttatus]|uniref:Uncharacterized protein n=1 Tax=Hemibagrus guttatus TaxID=175788 RepID=A0AAE0VA59_9TELE|nr:hypothetical protein QTP70_011333 [Hemibagrus guttatus]KAK3567111.1 hypothetical protein QTP86_009805 [Hemibagrus guttatus]